MDARLVEDKIEVVGPHRNIQIRTATVIKEDLVELTRTFVRKTLECVSSVYDGSSWTHTDTDVSGESTEVQGIAGVVKLLKRPLTKHKGKIV